MKRITASEAVLMLLLVSISSVAFSLMQIQPVDGVLTADEHTLALWHFNEGEGQIVYDESTHNNDGTLGPTSGVDARDPSWTAGFTGQPGDYALSMDDWYDYVNVPDNPDNSLDLLGGDQFTIEFWTYVRHVSRPDRGAGNHWNVWVSKRAHTRTGYTITQCSYYPKLSAYFYDETSASHGVGCGPTPTLQWVHVMFTYDGQHLRLYFDGVLQNENEVGHHFVAGNNQPLSIGKSLVGDEPWRDVVDCIIDEVRISSIARLPVPPVEDTAAYIDYLNKTIQDLPDGIFNRTAEDIPDTKNDFSDLFNDTLENINESNYVGAIEKLNSIKEKIYEDMVETAEREELVSLIDNLIAYLETLL